MAAIFRKRALIAGSVSGLAAIVAALVVRSDARWLFDRLFETPAVLSVAVSLLAGVATLVLVARWQLGAARASAAVAVAALVGGWALAQNPILLDGLTVREAAAPDNVMTLLVISILAGGLILFPSLALLFRLALRGSFSAEPMVVRGAPLAGPTSGLAATLTATRLAGACFVIGAAFLVIGDSGWPHAIGVAALTAFIVLGLARWRARTRASSRSACASALLPGAVRVARGDWGWGWRRWLGTVGFEGCDGALGRSARVASVAAGCGDFLSPRDPNPPHRWFSQVEARRVRRKTPGQRGIIRHTPAQRPLRDPRRPAQRVAHTRASRHLRRLAPAAPAHRHILNANSPEPPRRRQKAGRLSANRPRRPRPLPGDLLPSHRAAPAATRRRGHGGSRRGGSWR